MSMCIGPSFYFAFILQLVGLQIRLWWGVRPG